MKYILRSLMVAVLQVTLFAWAIFLALAAVVFAIFAIGLNLEEIDEHPFKALSSVPIAVGIGGFILWVARLSVLEAARSRKWWKTLADSEPPSFGKPPRLPTFQTPAPNPPKP